jgi:hypothetical protein
MATPKMDEGNSVSVRLWSLSSSADSDPLLL